MIQLVNWAPPTLGALLMTSQDVFSVWFVASDVTVMIRVISSVKSSRHLLNYFDCMDTEREDIENCCVLCCVQ